MCGIGAHNKLPLVARPFSGMLCPGCPEAVQRAVLPVTTASKTLWSLAWSWVRQPGCCLPHPINPETTGHITGPWQILSGIHQSVRCLRGKPVSPLLCHQGGWGLTSPHLISSVRCIRENRNLPAISVCHTGLPISNHRFSDRRHLVLNPKFQCNRTSPLHPPWVWVCFPVLFHCNS